VKTTLLYPGRISLHALWMGATHRPSSLAAPMLAPPPHASVWHQMSRAIGRRVHFLSS